MKNTLIEIAYELGRKAFKEGKVRISVADETFLKTCLKESDQVFNDSYKKFEAWNKGWDYENLKAEY